MNFSRQALLGIGMIIGGSVMLYAMAQQIGASDKPAAPTAIVEKSSTKQAAATPLTTDIDTEKRILAEKQKERAARVAEQERRAQQFLAEQESAEAKALAKSRAENEQYVANSTPVEVDSDSVDTAKNTEDTVTTPSAKPRTDTVTANTQANNDTKAAQQAKEKADAKKLADSQKQAEAKKRADAEAKAEKEKQAQAEKKAEAEVKKQIDAKRKSEEQAATKQKKQDEEKVEAAKQAAPKSPTDYTVKRGDGLIKLARQYNVPVAALAQANDMTSSTSLQVGQALTIPSRKQIERLEREAAAAQKSADAKREAQEKLHAARKEVKETDAKGSFGVQVALANNQASADEVAKKLKSAGYQVKTSATSRGVRVIVGPERGKVAALALKDKLNTDPEVDTSGAWVLYWR